MNYEAGKSVKHHVQVTWSCPDKGILHHSTLRACFWMVWHSGFLCYIFMLFIYFSYALTQSEDHHTLLTKAWNLPQNTSTENFPTLTSGVAVWVFTDKKWFIVVFDFGSNLEYLISLLLMKSFCSNIWAAYRSRSQLYWRACTVTTSPSSMSWSSG